jgi:hypothetical protein
MNQEVINRLRATAYRTIRILKEIEKGNRSPNAIAQKAMCTRALADYYLKQIVRSI